MKKLGTMICVAVLACSVLSVTGLAWYNTYTWSNDDHYESEYVSVPSTASVYIYGSGIFDSSGWAELIVTSPYGPMHCYTWDWLPENYASDYGLPAGDYLVEFSTHQFSGGNSVGYSVQINW